MPKQSAGKPTNYREQRRKEDRNLLFLVIFTLIVIGGGLIGFIYGVAALIGSLICLGGGALLILLLWGLLSGLEKISGD